MGRYYGGQEVKNFFKKTILWIYPALLIIPFIPVVRDFFEIESFLRILNFKTLRIFRASLYQASISTILCILFSIPPIAWLVRKGRNNSVAALIESTYFIPYFYPVASTVISFSILFSSEYFNIQYSLTAVAAAHVFYNTPIIIKYLSNSILKISPEIKESALLERINYPTIVLKIYLPIISKSLFRAIFLVFSFCFTSFGIIIALGNIRLATFESAIYQSIGHNFNFSKALSYALIQFLFLSIINFFISKTSGEQLSEESSFNNKRTKGIIHNFSILYLLYEFTIISAPIYFLFKFSISKNRNFLLNIFSESLNTDFPIMQSMINSIIVSFSASFIIIPIVYLLLRKHNHIIEFIITSSFGISSAVLSIAYIYLTIKTNLPVTAILIPGFIAVSLPFSFSFMQQHITGFNKDLFEAASLETSSFIKIFKNIEFPIIKNVLITAFLNSFALLYGEFTFAYIISSSANFPLISAVNFSLNAHREIGPSLAVNFLNIIIIFLAFIISRLFINSGKKWKGTL